MNFSEKQYKKISIAQGANSLVMLIAICLIIFVGLAFMKAIWFFRFPKELAPNLFDKNVIGLVAMPASPGQLASKPWTVLTHMFVHDNIWKIFANMLWL